jgi:hypothetical protein
MKLNSFVLFGILFSIGIVNAQTDFRPGYVILSSGDSLFGEIDYRGDLLMGKICKFKATDQTITEFFPNDLHAFRFIDSKYYVSREINSKKVFLEYLIKGRINIYYFRDEEGDRYYLDKNDLQLKEIPYEEKMKYVDGKWFFYESKLHVGLLNYYMQDAPYFLSRIQSIKKPEHKNLIKLAKDYHNYVCDDEECIVFEKPLPFLKVNLEMVAGIVNYDNIDNFADKNILQSGIILHFWLPRVNENFYFKTGAFYSHIEEAKTNLAKVSVPIHWGYMAPNTFLIRPSLSIGLLSPSYAGGVAIKIGDKINLGVQSWVNFFPYGKIGFIPEKLYNYSLLGSFYIEL